MAYIFSGTDTAWDDLVGAHAADFFGAPVSGAFLQSSAWARVQEKRGNKIARVVDGAGNPSLWVLLTIKKIFTVWYCAKGPLVLPGEHEWEESARALSRVCPATLIRFEPHTPPPEKICGHAVKKHKDVSPAYTHMTQCARADAELLASFHEKTRYNIRVAERHGCVARRLHVDEQHARAQELLALYHATGARHDIAPLPVRDLVALFGEADVWVVEYENKIIATSLHMGFAGVMTYVHGASQYEQRALMAPYALHWAAIQDARARGFAQYDWWGVAPPAANTSPQAPRHPLVGVTRFKLGWGGREVSDPGTFEYGVGRVGHALYATSQRIRRGLQRH